MKAQLTKDLIESLSGPMGKDLYASNAPGEPGWVIIKKKPGPRNPKGKRTNLWVMPEEQAQCVRSFKNIVKTATVTEQKPSSYRAVTEQIPSRYRVDTE